MGKQINTMATLSGSARGLLLCIALFLISPLIFAYWEDHEARSQWENRSLEDKPQWQGMWKTREYFTNLSTYIDDHLGLALWINKIYRKAVFNILKDSPVDNITVGMDNFIFLNAGKPENRFAMLKSFCPHEVKQGLLNERRLQVEKIYKYYTQKGYRVHFAIAPSKLALYPDKLGDTVPLALREKCTSNKHIKEILLPLFIEEKIYYPYEEMKSESMDTNYYPSTNYHWRGKSAHSFALGFLSKIGIEMGVDYSTGAHATTGNTDLSMMGFRQEIVYEDYPYSQYDITRRRNLSWIKPFYNRIRDFSVYYAGRPETERTALVISNSFGAFVAPHLAPAFKSLHHVSINHLTRKEENKFFNAFIDSIAPTDLIFVLHDQVLIKGNMLSRVL